MAAVSDGLNGFFGSIGVTYINELKRRAAQMLVEATAQPGIPRTVSILRMTSNNNGNLAAGIAPTWTAVAGLANLPAAVLSTTQWKEELPGVAKVEFKDADRVIVLADVPGGKVLPSDHVVYTDPVYGAVTFDVIDVMFDDAANICRLLVKYAKED